MRSSPHQPLAPTDRANKKRKQSCSSYHKLRKTFGKFLRSYSELMSKFGDISFQELYVKTGLLWWSSLQTKEVQRRTEFHLVGFEKSQSLRRRHYDSVIIERTIGLVFGPFTALYIPFLKHCTLTNKAVGTIWRALSKPPQRLQGPDLCPLWLLIGTPSATRPKLASRRAEHSRPYSDVDQYIFDI